VYLGPAFSNGNWNTMFLSGMYPTISW